jgi:hypothetical protein
MPQAYEKGVLEDSTYVNKMANIQCSVPPRWDAKTGNDALLLVGQSTENEDGSQKNTMYQGMDFACKNPDSGSGFAVLYTPKGSLKLESFAEQTVKSLLLSSFMPYKETGSYYKTIAGHDSYVVTLEANVSDYYTAKEYLCFFEVESYVCIIHVYPNPIGVGNETFDGITNLFTAVQ